MSEAETGAPQAEAIEYKDRYLRALADYANMKKRLEKDVLSARDSGKIELLKDLLPVIDTFNAVAKAVSNDASGIDLAIIQLQDTLTKLGLKEVNPIGQVFSYDSHECIGTRPGDETLKGTVCEVARYGYEYQGVIIRYPQVIVVG